VEDFVILIRGRIIAGFDGSGERGDQVLPLSLGDVKGPAVPHQF
jgi:hypothetical protein